MKKDKQITLIHDKVQKLAILISSIDVDIKKFLYTPENYVASEYFQDVGEATNEAQLIMNTISTLLVEENWRSSHENQDQ